MTSQQGAGGSPDGMAMLAVDPQRGLALLERHHDRITFEGIALGPGVYVDAAERRIRVREEHLPLVAQRVQGVFLRDLHREDLGASVGVVADARLEAEVRFTGDVRLAPYVELIRHFWSHIRFSLGFRYDPGQLVLGEDGTYDLPRDFVVDHLALVPQGQYPNARLVRLLNQARGLAPSISGGTSMPGEEKELNELRQQRDDALRAADKAHADVEVAKAAGEQAKADLGRGLAKARADLEAATKLAEAARLELGLAKNRVAADVMKLELAAGKDFDLDQRKKELLAFELAALDKLRGELKLAASETAKPADHGDEAPATVADHRETAAGAKAGGLELERLTLADTLRLAAEQGVL